METPDWKGPTFEKYASYHPALHLNSPLRSRSWKRLPFRLQATSSEVPLSFTLIRTIANF